MPKRTDIKKILIIGSGPIVIGQGCEFDYSGAQACKAIREEGYEVVLVNSNPATIMTDPVMADRTYIEPITPEVVSRIIERERPDALLPTLGGQTALNVAIQVADMGVLAKYGVEMIGANYEAIQCAEDRDKFRSALQEIGIDLPRSKAVRTLDEAREAARDIGFPAIIRPSFTLGGSGASVAYNSEEFERAVNLGLELSLITEVLIEESVIGWKEFELEVMRDRKDNVVIICSIENLDPMGVHTGDSITVAPAQTLTDRQYQQMRDAAIAIIRRVGVETGGSNIQFAVHPETGRMVAIEMNPRVSRSSALASKATGFPIAKFAAKLAVGYTLDEMPNDITKETPASFEPTIDYCVVKLPRFAFEKFAGADDTLTISMKSVGETMAIGRTFKEAFQKGLRGLEIGLSGLDAAGERKVHPDQLEAMLVRPTPERLFYVRHALQHGMSVQRIHELSRIDPWFLHNIREIVEMEDRIKAAGSSAVSDANFLRRAKRMGFSDKQMADLTGSDELSVRKARIATGVKPVYKLVDTCAAEFEAYTPYYYSTYDTEDESRSSSKPKALIIGGGPNRIGQGIEFDYCCVHASLALRELGYDSIMVNSNPETVSTDYDVSSRLYFEPLTFEDILNIIEREQPEGVIVQLGGQTPLNLSGRLARAGVRILGTSPEATSRAEDRELFRQLIEKLNLRQPPSDTVDQPRRRARGRLSHRLSDPRASFVRLGRSSDGHRVERERDGRRAARGDGSGAGPSGAYRQIPRRRHRGGCRCDQRRAPRHHRRRDGAHRAGGHPLRRQRDGAAALFAQARPHRGNQGPDAPHGVGAWRCRSDERPIRGERRRRLRPGGEPESFAHGAVRLEGDGRAAGEHGDEDHARGHARRLARRAARAAVLCGEGVGVALQSLRRRGPRSRPGDEIDRRGDGRRHVVRTGVCQVADGQLSTASPFGKCFHQRARRRQGSHPAGGAGIRVAGLQHSGDGRHGGKARIGGPSRAQGAKDFHRSSEHS